MRTSCSWGSPGVDEERSAAGFLTMGCGFRCFRIGAVMSASGTIYHEEWDGAGFTDGQALEAAWKEGHDACDVRGVVRSARGGFWTFSG